MTSVIHMQWMNIDDQPFCSPLSVVLLLVIGKYVLPLFLPKIVTLLFLCFMFLSNLNLDKCVFGI